MRSKKERIYYIKRENRANKKLITPVMNRKDFRALTADKNCFGKITPGIKPEEMSDAEYDIWIHSKPEGKLII